MKYFALMLLLLVSIDSIAQQTDAAPVTRFYLFKGTIGKYPVTLLLHRINDGFSGAYYYHSIGSPINITGHIEKKEYLDLSHTSKDENHYETFTGVFRDSSYSGTWRSNGSKLFFELKYQNDSSSLQFDYVQTYGSRKLANKPAHMSHIEELDYEARTVWPASRSKHPSKQLLQQLIRELFGEKGGNEEIGKILERQKNKFLATTDKDIDLYESSDAVNIDYMDDRLICLAQNWNNYSGGAHGMYGCNYINIDLQNNRKLMLSDVIDTTAAKKSVERMLEQQFRKNFPFEKGEKLAEVLLVEKISMTDNFMLTGKGIGFNYDPYEIAAYAYGQIFLFIPYRDIQSFLKPEFKKLMRL